LTSFTLPVVYGLKCKLAKVANDSNDHNTAWQLQASVNMATIFKTFVTVVIQLTVLIIILVHAGDWLLCPTGCKCIQDDSSLSISCFELVTKNADNLTQQIDLMLSSATMQRVKSLSINDSPLSTFPLAICCLFQLNSLNLDRNRLAGRLPDNCLSKLVGLVDFSASRNRLTQIQDGLFDGLRRLRNILLDENQISTIGLRVFSNASDLPALRTISLMSNQLTNLEPWPAIRGLAASSDDRATVRLSRNFISNFTNNIGWKYHCNGEAPYVDLSLSYNAVSHVSDFVSGWRIGDLITLICLLHRRLQVSLYRNDLVCDCTDFCYLRILDRFQHTTTLSEVYCGSPAELNGKEIMRVPIDQFVCEVVENCPPGCHCVIRPANASLHVYCSNSSLRSLPRELPSLPHSYSWYVLDFSNNVMLHRLEYREYFRRTAILHVVGSGIKEFDEKVWMSFSNMRHVNLDGNSLTSLPSALMAANFSNLKMLNLGGNPWRCSCEDKKFGSWVQLMKVQNVLQNPDNILCETPSRLSGKSMVYISMQEFCTDPAKEIAIKAISTSVSSFVGIVLFILLTCLVAYRVRVQLHSRWNFHPFDRDECTGEDMDYDVFLCCSSDDHWKYALPVLELLESKKYRVCYHLRDFPVGELIDTTIVNSVIRSKRTICLISSNFLSR